MEGKEDSVSSSPSKSPKKTYAFGIPDHGKLPFSQLSHLSPVNRQFATQLATTDHKNRIPHSARGDAGSSHAEKQKANAAAAKKAEAQISEAELLALDGVPEGEKGVAPCIRQDCRDTVVSIIETQTRNAVERNEIVQECEKMIQMQQQLEEECLVIDDENKRMIIEGNMLEMRLKVLTQSLEKSEALKRSLDNEKDELSSKLMMMELEKQRTARLSQDIQTALNDIMWKGSSSLLKDNGHKSTLHIKPHDERAFTLANNPTMTKYEWVVNDRLLDISERPKTVPILPSNLRLLKPGSNDISMKSMSTRDALLTLKKSNTCRSIRTPAGSVTSDLSFNTRLLPLFQDSCTSPIRSRTGTVRFNKPINESSFKGYTPSGGRRTLGTASSQRLAQTDSMSIGNGTAGSQSSGLDPVFYAERARTSWGREKKLGKVRMRGDPEGYRRKMLTSVGHPGVFGSDELDDERDLQA